MKLYFFLFCCGYALMAQTPFPKNYFRSPLDIPMQLSGNFGELRPNHFHAGFDFKTQHREGLSVFAAADGYVSRIKISTFGYGKAIYITHPNGFTTVYAHLQRAIESIQAVIKKRQYEEKSFEVDLFFKPNELVVTKGQQIGFSGNTGSSEGPHLHFEIRDSKSEFVINPYLFGFDSFIKDTKKPQIATVFAFPLDHQTTVNQSLRPIPVNLKLQKDGTYLADPVLAKGKIGFGIIANDVDDVSLNKNGVYDIKTFYNGSPSYNFQMTSFSFDETRFINALIDYERYKKAKQRIQRLYRKSPFNLNIINTDVNNGIITVGPNLWCTYRIEVSDYFNNTTKITIPIAYDVQSAVIPKEAKPSNYFIKATKDNIFEKDNWTVTFPANTFYDDFDMNFSVASNILTLHDDTVPAHTAFTVQFQDDTNGTTNKEKMFIGRIEGGRMMYNPTTLNGTTFTAKVKSLGKFALVLDNVNPVISISKPIEGKLLDNQKTIQVSIGDALSGIKSYNGYINDQWILMEYDNKTKLLTHNLSDGIVSEGENNLKVIVIDQVGNSTTFETRFLRSQISK